MKVLIVSDTHGRDGLLKKIIEEVSPIDLLIHCGDVEGSEDYIEALAGCPVEMVAGNNDFFSSLEREREFSIGDYQVLLTHGHYYGVSMGTRQIQEEAGARNKDIVFFGHTHKPVLDEGDGVIAVNPGSLSFPRQEGRQPTYMVMEIDQQGKAHFQLNYAN